MLLIPIAVALVILAAIGLRQNVRWLSAAFVLTTCVARPCVIPTGSMEPTIPTWSLVALDVRPGQSFSHNQIVCFPGPQGDRLYCKRLIGLGGDVLEMRRGQLLRNGVPQKEPWSRQASQEDSWGPLQVPSGACFLLGDNRGNSFDSRFWGCIPVDFLMGRVIR
jgi:signal peptidase I